MGHEPGSQTHKARSPGKLLSRGRRLGPRLDAGSYAVVYVRPETNTVLYERAIAAAIRGRGDEVIYLANLGGALIEQDGILKGPLPTQLRFAADPQREAARYPEIGRAPRAAFRRRRPRSP